MSIYKDAFKKFLDNEGLKYLDFDERTVRIGWSTKTGNIDVFVIYDAGDANKVHIMTGGFCKCPDEKLLNILITCNDLNQQYRWCKFYLSKDNDVIVEDDAILDIANAGQEVFELVTRMVSITEDAYPKLMAAIYA